MISSLENLTDIPERQYEGYIWFSDSQEPEVLFGNKPFSFHSPKDNPFVVEALLYSRHENVSVMVKHTGKYHITEYDINKINSNGILIPKEYLPHRLKDVSKVCFFQFWSPESDPNCLNMEVQTLRAIIFSGFDKQPKI
jgi:CRISPR type III-associated protein (TIGR04423 family)